jgi:hypothetical protein
MLNKKPLILFISALLTLNFLVCPILSVNWYDSNWQYRKTLSLTGSGTAGTNYQMKIIVGYNSGGDINCGGKCKSDFSDIRSTDNDGVTLLDYWRENLYCFKFSNISSRSQR